MNYQPINLLYDLSHKVDTFGLQRYTMPKQYVDPYDKSLQKSKSTGLKCQYIEDIIRQSKGTPGPFEYNQVTKWPEPHPKLDKKQVQRPPDRQFFHGTKYNKTPGVGAYQISRFMDDIQKESKDDKKLLQAKEDRQNQIDSMVQRGAYIPGPGQYNPRQVSGKKIVENQMNNPKSQMQKAREQYEKEKRSFKYPSPVSYNPNYQQSFEKYSVMQDSKSTVSKTFGTSKRFKTSKVNQSDIGPGKYDIIQQWDSKKGIFKCQGGMKPINVYYNKD